MRLRHIILFLLMAVFITPVRAGHKDHLGNNREVVNVGGTVKQVTNYYPFGAPYADPAAVMSASLQPYKYNGKELDLMHGLNTYDYGAHQYYSIVGRWDRTDPLCEKYYSVSPYAYCKNSPTNAIDPDGRAVNFLVGAGTEYVTQVASNIITKGVKVESFVNIDIGDIAIASMVGAATGGLSAINASTRAIKVGTSITGEFVKAHYDVDNNNGTFTMSVNNGSKTTNNLIGAGVGKGAGKITGKFVSKTPTITNANTNLSNNKLSKIIKSIVPGVNNRTARNMSIKN